MVDGVNKEEKIVKEECKCPKCGTNTERLSVIKSRSSDTAFGLLCLAIGLPLLMLSFVIMAKAGGALFIFPLFAAFLVFIGIGKIIKSKYNCKCSKCGFTWLAKGERE